MIPLAARVLILALAAGITLAGGPVCAREPPPNILVIVTDNQPWWAMGCAGNPIISTPHLDRLAAEGVRFRNAFVTTPICAASRASLFTGLYRRKHGFTFNTAPLRAEIAAASYPALLRKAGYRTALIGKFGIESNGKLQVEDEKQSLRLMFDHFDNFEHWGKSGPKGYFVNQPDGTARHLTDVTADKAVSFLAAHGAGQAQTPFCLTLCFNAPHAQDDDPKQYFWPARFDGLYQDSIIPPPHNADAEFFRGQPAFLRSSLGRERWRWRFDTPVKFQTMMKGMYRMVSAVDEALGRVRVQLEKQEIHRNTVILFTSDNGMFFGERGLSDCWLLYEESLRVPLIIFDPRNERKDSKNRVCEEMVLNLDLAPTILELASLQANPTTDGRSLLPLLTDREGEKWREDFLCEHLFAHDKIPKSEGVRTTRWKYIRYFEEKPVYEELYDLAGDPHERVNLAGRAEHSGVLEKLRQRCGALIAEASR